MQRNPRGQQPEHGNRRPHFGIREQLVIALFMFGFPSACFGMFFDHSRSWGFWATAIVACLMIPPLLIVSLQHTGRPTRTKVTAQPLQPRSN